MTISIHTILFTALLSASSPQGPYGHWEGSIATPGGEMPVVIDLWASADGKSMATYSNPAKNLHGLPLANVVTEARSATFEIASGDGGAFDCALDEDGKTMMCGFSPRSINATVPLSLVRTGEAQVAPALHSPAVPVELEGVWKGALAANGGSLELILKMANQPGGTATASVVSVNEGGIEVPAEVAFAAGKLTVDLKAVGTSWSGELNTGGNELSGTFREGSLSLPLSFRRTVAMGTPGKQNDAGRN